MRSGEPIRGRKGEEEGESECSVQSEIKRSEANNVLNKYVIQDILLIMDGKMRFIQTIKTTDLLSLSRSISKIQFPPQNYINCTKIRIKM